MPFGMLLVDLYKCIHGMYIHCVASTGNYRLISTFFDFFLVHICSSGDPEAHQSLDARLEEKNQGLKVWAPADPDAEMWRSLVRNDAKLSTLRGKLLAVMAMKDAKSQARSRPPYDEDLLRWRARLRPFLTGGNKPAEQRPFESMTGEQLSDDILDITEVGQQRRVELYREHFAGGGIPLRRKKQKVLPVTMLEKLKIAESTSDSTSDSSSDED